jgi:hypothetical protein
MDYQSNSLLNLLTTTQGKVTISIHIAFINIYKSILLHNQNPSQSIKFKTVIKSINQS